MTTRTQAEKDLMIQKLEESKKTLPEFNAFGDNNWQDIENAQQVIREEMDEDDIYDAFDENPDFLILAVEWLEGNNSVIPELLNLPDDE